jgi:hypothetical protein
MLFMICTPYELHDIYFMVWQHSSNTLNVKPSPPFGLNTNTYDITEFKNTIHDDTIDNNKVTVGFCMVYIHDCTLVSQMWLLYSDIQEGFANYTGYKCSRSPHKLHMAISVD